VFRICKYFYGSGSKRAFNYGSGSYLDIFVAADRKNIIKWVVSELLFSYFLMSTRPEMSLKEQKGFGSVIQNYKYESRRPINYGSCRIRKHSH
jgi:hypothetical protein